MKYHRHFIRCLRSLSLLAISLSITQVAQAQYSAVRLIAKEANAGRATHYGSSSLAVGTEIIALGAPRQVHNSTGFEAGAVFLWDIKTGKQRKTIYPPASIANDGARFGYALAISGKHLVIGAPGADASFGSATDDRGAAYVYDINTGKLLHTIIAGFPGSGYGEAVAMDRGQVAVGAPADDIHGANAGNCIVYDLAAGTITSVVPVAPATPLSPGDAYGSALAFRNGVLAVGAPLATVSGQAGAGRVYLMDSGVDNSAIVTIDNPDPSRTVPASALNDEFGQSIAFTGIDFLAIGARLDENPALAPTDSGSVSQYDIIDILTPLLQSTAYGANSDDLFGYSLAGAPNQLYASSPSEDNIATDSGVVSSASSPSFLPTPLQAGDQLGTSISYNTGVLVALAAGDDTAAVDAGAVWLFTSPRNPSLNSQGNIVMALKGESAIGAPQTVHSSFTQISVPQDGSFDFPSFVGQLTGPGTAGGTTQGFWSWSGIYPTLVRLTGTTVPNPIVANSITGMVENVSGSRWFYGKDLAVKKVGLFSNDSGVESVPIYEGLDTGSGTVKKLLPGRADNVTPVGPSPGLYLQPYTYTVGTGGTLATSDSAIWLSDSTVYREGSAAGFPGGFTNGQMPSRAALSGSRPLFTQSITGGGSTAADNVVVTDGSNLLLRKNAPAPNALGGTTGTFKAFLGETLSSTSGAALVRATLAGVPAAQNEGLWTNRGGSFFPIFMKGAQAPLMATGVTVKKFISYSITEFNDVLALVQIGGKGVTAANDLVLYHNIRTVTEPGDYSILLREGNRIPGQDNAKVGVIQMVDYTTATDGSNHSYYGVLATLVNEKGAATAATNLVWLTGNISLGFAGTPAIRLPQVILRKGVSSEFPVGKHSIASFSIPVKPTDTAGAGNTGLPHAVSAGARTSSLVVTYPDKSQGVMILVNPLEAP